MNDLFLKTKDIPVISGLNYYPDFITPEEEHFLIDSIDKHAWQTDLKRRVQHYGYKYDYKARSVLENSFIGELPDWIAPLCKKLLDKKIFHTKPDQVIVNEYLPGQGISEHIDCVPCFGEIITSLTLGCGATMIFKNNAIKKEIYLEPLSLISLCHSARYEWSHSIPARKSDKVNGNKIDRKRRISLTFRNVIIT